MEKNFSGGAEILEKVICAINMKMNVYQVLKYHLKLKALHLLDFIDEMTASIITLKSFFMYI